MLLNEYLDEASHSAAARLALDVAPAVSFQQVRRFRGSLGWRWERSVDQILASGWFSAGTLATAESRLTGAVPRMRCP